MESAFDLSPEPSERPTPSPARQTGATRINPIAAVWRQRRIAAITFVAVFALTLIAIHLPGRRYLATGSLLIQQNSTDEQGLQRVLQTQCEIIRSNAVLAIAAAQAQPDASLDTIASHLKVSVGEKDDTVIIALTGPSGLEAAEMVNAIIDAYQSLIQTSHKTIAQSAVAQLQQLKQGQDAQLAAARAQLQQALTEAAALPATQSAPISADALASAQQLADDAQRQYEIAAGFPVGTADTLPAEPGDETLDLSNPPSAQQVDQLDQEIAAVQQRLAEMRDLYSPHHPLLTSAEEQLALLNSQRIKLTRWRWLAAQSRQRQLAAQAQVQAQQRAIAATQADNIGQLRQQITTLEQADNSLNDQITQAIVQESQPPIQVTVLNRAESNAVPLWPPSIFSTLLIAGAAGLFFGAGAAIGREMWDPRLYTPESAQVLTSLPALGRVPKLVGVLSATARCQKVSIDPGSEFAEAFRTLRTNLQFAADAAPRRILAVVSAQQGEGRSSCACNLAIVFANSGRRVVLVDACFSNPSVHTSFALSNKLGLSNVLSGGAAAEVLQRSPVPRLDILCAGSQPRDVYEALNSGAFMELLEGLGDRYDMVIFDTPPVLRGNDARIIAAHCDAAILVMRGGQSERRGVVQSIAALRSVGATIAGFIFNDVEPQSPGGRAPGQRTTPPQQPTARGVTMQEMGSLKRHKPGFRAGGAR